ncbi:hypothetical protein F8M41_025013 [Gigaspora margarita]|uniref:Uncharacterized protein n=1 Tax=Gigaspora margarita TaxID=4874 RepID=A0A8H4AAG2_GIGMA|nr:hypothetical protein F8M41_025013 [Gigaspora margarita]
MVLDRSRQQQKVKKLSKKLTSIIREIKCFSLGDIKAAAKKMQEENLEYQVVVLKNKLTEDCQLLLETLQVTHKKFYKITTLLSKTIREI